MLGRALRTMSPLIVDSEKELLAKDNGVGLLGNESLQKEKANGASLEQNIGYDPFVRG